MNDYTNMIQGLPQGGDQSQYLASMGMPQRAGGVAGNGQPANAPGQQQSMGLPRLQQGQPGMGPQGMPSNGQGPQGNPMQAFAQRMMAQRGMGQPQGQGQPQGNPFMQAIARWHAMNQGQGQPGMPGQGQPHLTMPGDPSAPGAGGAFPGVQWGAQPVPQGMRGPGTMPPPGQAPGMQGVQWGGPVQQAQGPGQQGMPINGAR
jgi:hypothetical protein